MSKGKAILTKQQGVRPECEGIEKGNEPEVVSINLPIHDKNGRNKAQD
jgi:hypothetical protein